MSVSKSNEDIDDFTHQPGSSTSFDDLRPALLRLGFDSSRADSVVHALADIRESVDKIYDQILPVLLEASGLSDEELRDKLWDIREEFRHVDYHVHDGQLTDL